MVPTTEGSTPHNYRGHRAGPAPVAQWVGLFLAPAAFFLNLQGAYLAVLRDCGRAGGPWLVHAANLAFLLVAIAGLWAAWLTWVRAGSEEPGDRGDAVGRTRLVAALGLGVSAHATLVLAAQLVMGFVLPRCQ